ncbi:hypothetical protein DY000_02048616 [Brassica cretica]|uniref:Uncharacterized protein n=1 Tax=Brassica cretica TaxID=69181 RepID=A0ABQ7F7C9_BRACR|nr:hypothetical protein DY000_02048616 [Brassica cretica]
MLSFADEFFGVSSSSLASSDLVKKIPRRYLDQLGNFMRFKPVSCLEMMNQPNRSEKEGFSDRESRTCLME